MTRDARSSIWSGLIMLVKPPSEIYLCWLCNIYKQGYFPSKISWEPQIISTLNIMYYHCAGPALHFICNLLLYCNCASWKITIACLVSDDPWPLVIVIDLINAMSLIKFMLCKMNRCYPYQLLFIWHESIDYYTPYNKCCWWPLRLYNIMHLTWKVMCFLTANSV